MREMTLSINTNGIDLTVGKLHIPVGPGELSFDVPKCTYFGETGYVEMTGLQYYDASGFLFLLSVITDEEERHHILEIDSVFNSTDDVYYLPEFEGGLKGFNKLAGEYLEKS